MCRACSALETSPYYRGDDRIAPLLLPRPLRSLFGFAPARKLFARVVAPKGIYEYVIARTRYIDAAFERALAEGFDQTLIFGAGFDTRAVRFRDALRDTRVFELDVPVTQEAKIRQYRKRRVPVPPNLTFIAIDFDKESLPAKLDEAGFRKGRRDLFVLEGLVMYLQPESVDATFRTIREYAGAGSRVVFDHIHASVMREGDAHYGGAEIVDTVSHADEHWHFGLEKGEVAKFLDGYDMGLVDHKDAKDLERAYFSDPNGRVVARVNGTHCLVTAEKRAAASR